MEAKDDDDLHGGQSSTEVKCGKLSSMATKLVRIIADARLGR